ncbi:MAG: DsbA family protein [Rhizobiales bacterium]|nr:DsbA family protein [Hyphomicrobiales bacterium]
MTSTFRAALLAIFMLFAPATAMADEFDAKQRDEIGAIVRDYLLKNPEILIEMSKELEKRQQVAEDQQREIVVSEKAAELFHSKSDFVAGNPKGDVTMVEFFDYNCSWCKRGMPEVVNLIEGDKNLRIVLKEFPIFGEDSEYAAHAALASNKQGKYWQFHLAMLGHEGKLAKTDVDAIATAQGLDLALLKKDMESPEIAETIGRNQKLAQDLAINATPAFVIDRKVIVSYLPKEALAAAIKEIRDAGGCTVC